MINTTFLRHIKNEKNHWWFKSRREILNFAIKRIIKNKLEYWTLVLVVEPIYPF